MGDYFAHWLKMQERIAQPPKIFMVNWFRQDKNGKYLWPGFGENMRVLKWVVDRARGKTGAQETIVGWVPRAGDLDLSGIDISADSIEQATAINLDEWRQELESQGEFFEKIGPTMPAVIKLNRDLLMARLETYQQK
jgi:phosphoenolpyruvate carboxykinase (GTP)